MPMRAVSIQFHEFLATCVRVCMFVSYLGHKMSHCIVNVSAPPIRENTAMGKLWVTLLRIGCAWA